MDKRLVTVILMAVVVALVITAIFYQITIGRRQVQAEVPKKVLIVAKQNLPIGKEITYEDLRAMDFPAEAYPKGAFGSEEDVIERSVVSPILENEPILAGRVTEKGAGVGLAPLIPEGKRAVAIAINQVTGVSGYINPGSDVDILLTGTPKGGAEQITTTVLENVTVLSTGHRLQMDPNGKPQNVPVLNMLLTPNESELLTLATQAGRIHLVLRNPMDEEETAKARKPVRQSDLWAKARRRAARPAPRPRRAAPPPPPPPPPPPAQVEMIRGNKRSVQRFSRTAN